MKINEQELIKLIKEETIELYLEMAGASPEALDSMAKLLSQGVGSESEQAKSFLAKRLKDPKTAAAAQKALANNGLTASSVGVTTPAVPAAGAGGGGAKPPTGAKPAASGAPKQIASKAAPKALGGPTAAGAPKQIAKKAATKTAGGLSRFLGPIATGAWLGSEVAPYLLSGVSKLTGGDESPQDIRDGASLGWAYLTGGEEAAYAVWSQQQVEKGKTPPTYEQYKKQKDKMAAQELETAKKVATGASKQTKQVASGWDSYVAGDKTKEQIKDLWAQLTVAKTVSEGLSESTMGMLLEHYVILEALEGYDPSFQSWKNWYTSSYKGEWERKHKSPAQVVSMLQGMLKKEPTGPVEKPTTPASEPTQEPSKPSAKDQAQDLKQQRIKLIRTRYMRQITSGLEVYKNPDATKKEKREAGRRITQAVDSLIEEVPNGEQYLEDAIPKTDGELEISRLPRSLVRQINRAIRRAKRQQKRDIKQNMNEAVYDRWQKLIK